MNTHLTVLASLGVAILLSPETLILGLIMACDRRAPRLVAWMYAVGAVVGLVMGITIGMLVGPSHHAEAAAEGAKSSHPWVDFIVRALIAGVLLTIGIQRAMHAIRGAPIEAVEEQRTGASKHGPGIVARCKAWFADKFGGSMGADLSVSRRCVRSGLLGFATMGIHPKCLAITIAAGHQIAQITDHAARPVAIAVFSAISLVPSIAPAVIETLRSGACAAMKESTERFMKKNGRWVSATILLGAGAYVAWNAFKSMP